MACNSRLHLRRGFTLIELLVAITILAIVAVLGWRGLDSIVRARVALTAELETSRRTQITFSQLENDCSYMPGVNLFPAHEAIQAQPQGLVLIRQVFDDNLPTRLQVVVYRFQNNQLIRKESAATRDLYVLDAYWQSALSDTDNFPSVTLQKDVQAFSLRTWTQADGAWRVAGTDIASTVNANSVAQPVLAPNGVPLVAAPTNLKTGLEVSLQLSGQSQPMVKVLLLGAV